MHLGTRDCPGWPKVAEAHEVAWSLRAMAANVLPIILEVQRAGAITLREVADALNDMP